LNPQDPTQAAYAGRQVGHYRIEALIGHGGMGEVYRAWDHRWKRPVAIKALHNRLVGDSLARDRFIRETRLAGKVVHPYVATVMDLVEDDENLLLVMEHIDGRRLSTVLREDRPSLEQITRYTIEIAEGLAAIHKAGILHRDLKPGNVMVTTDGHIKLLDFGVARPIVRRGERADSGDEITGVATLTEEGLGVGTVAYMSPEQVRGERDLDQRSDMFSLGSILYEAITGEHPFRRGSILDTAAAILNEPPGGGSEPETLTNSGPLRQVVMRLLEKDRDVRYENADTLITDLRALARGEHIEVRVAPRPRRRARRAVTILPWVLAGVMTAVLGWVGWQQFKDRGPIETGIERSSRPGVIVLPLQGAEEPEAEVQGSMLASILRADLAQIDVAPVVGSTRTEEVLAGLEPGATSVGRAHRTIMDVASARFLVSGSFTRQDEQWVATLELYDREAPNEVAGFQARGRTSMEVVDTLSSEIGSRLATVLGSTYSPDVDYPVDRLTSGSEGALLAAERGRHALRNGDPGAAERHYGEATDRDPRFIRAYLERAKTLYDTGYVTRAQEEVAKAVGEAQAAATPLPETLRLEIEAARARVHEDRDGEIRAWAELRRLREQSADVRAELAAAYARAVRRGEALEAIDEAITLEPGNPGHHLLRAELLWFTDRLDDADAAVRQAEDIDRRIPGTPFEPAIRMQQGYIQTARKSFESARTAYDAAADLYAGKGNPMGVASGRLAIARAFLLEGRLKDALPPLRQAAEEFATAGDARKQGSAEETLAAILLQQGAFTEAEPHVREALRIARETGGEQHAVSPMNNLASVLIMLGRWEEAEPILEEAARIAGLQQNAARVRRVGLYRAAVDFERGDFNAAERGYRQVVDGGNDDGDAGWAWAGLAELRSYAGDVGGALDAAKRAVAIQSATGQSINEAYALVWRARAHRISGGRDAFAEDLRAIDEAVSGSGALLDLTARCALERGLDHLEQGDLKAAETELLRILDWEENAAGIHPQARSALGRVWAGNGDTERGLEAARRGLRDANMRADRVVALTDLAAVLATAKRFEEARAHALRALDDAETTGMRWETVRAATIALSLPEGERPAGIENVRRRGSGALRKLLAGAPGGEQGPMAARPEVRKAIEALGG
jgi:tetratricopeptide (TPR) repeat protein